MKPPGRKSADQGSACEKTRCEGHLVFDIYRLKPELIGQLIAVLAEGGHVGRVAIEPSSGSRVDVGSPLC